MDFTDTSTDATDAADATPTVETADGQFEVPPPELATPADLDRYTQKFLQHNDIEAATGRDPNPVESYYAKADGDALGRNVKSRAQFPWLHDPSQGVRWDFDPISLRNIAQENTWVGMLVGSITKEIAETPWTIVEADGRVETQKRLSTHPEERTPTQKDLPDATAERIYDLLANPNPDDDWQDLAEMWMADLLEVGSLTAVKAFKENAYSGQDLTADAEYIEPRALQASPPEVWTKEYHDKAGIVEGYWQFDDHKTPGSGSADGTRRGAYGGSQPTAFDRVEVVWSDMSPRTNRRYGLPPTLTVKDFLQSLDLAITQEQQYLSRGSIPSGAWVFENWDREQLKERRQEMTENVKGKPHKSLMFAGQDGDVKFEAMSMNFDELQFTERMKWYARVVASAFQVPTAVVGIEPERVNYNTFQGERENFEANTLGPYLQKLERVINDQIIAPHWGRGTYRFEFKPGMSESTRKMISDRVTSEVQAGIRTPNEGRREIGLDESDEEGADTLGTVDAAEDEGGPLDPDGGMGGDAGFFGSAEGRVAKQDIPDEAYTVDDPSECGGRVVQGPEGGTYCVPDGSGGDGGEPMGDVREGDPPESVNLENETDSQDLTDAGITDGSNHADMRIAQLDDGSEVFVRENVDDFTAGRIAAGFNVYEQAGVPIPDTHVDDGTLAKEAIDGDTLRQGVDTEVDEESVVDAYAASILTGDTDMHGGNMMIREDGTAVPIDIAGSGGPVDSAADKQAKIETMLDMIDADIEFEDIATRAEEMAADIDPDEIPDGPATDNIRSNVEALR